VSPAKKTDAPKQRLVLIDGHSLIHRSFHALKQMKEPLKSAATGELTFGVFGFTNTFLAMFGELEPTHVIVALDARGPTFRHEISKEYKATRVAMPEEERAEFSRQMERCREMIETFGIPMFEVQGFEADDVLGTLSKQAEEQGIETYLVSMDSDIAQLVRDDVHLWMYRPYQRDSVVYKAPSDVEQRYGVPPALVPDLKALKGDTSDNIPGVKGVGDKTAIKLLQDFGSVEGILEHIDDVKPEKLQNAIREAADQLPKSKHLATIVMEVPAQLDLEAADFYAHYDQQKVADLFRLMEFRTLVSRLPQGTAATVSAKPVAAEKVEQKFSIVRDEAELKKLAKEIAARKGFVLDLETDTREPMRANIVGVTIGLGEGEAYYVPVGHAPRLGDGAQLPPDVVLQHLAPVIEDAKVAITGHNIKFDIVTLSQHGVNVRGVEFDTMIAAFLVGEGGGSARAEEGNLSLTWLAPRRIGVELQDRAELLGSGKKAITAVDTEIEAMAQCACAFADAAGRLRANIEPELDEKGMRKLFDEMEMPLVSTLARMEQNGVAIDTGALREMAESLAMDIARIEQDIYDSVGHEFNIGSPKQLSDILFEELRLPKTRRLKTGGYSTDAQSLEGLRGLHPMVDLIYEYRELTKLKSTYLDTLPGLVHPRTNRVHTEFNQTGAATGRLSSTNPNLQNIPVRTKLGEQIRRAFVARDVGKDPELLSADYSQIELRIMAHITGDPGLVGAFERDEDIHAATASQVFNVPIGGVTPDMRRRAKVFNFGVLYGLSEYGLSVREKISREEAANFIRSYFESYPGIREYVDRTIAEVRRSGYVQTLFGRRRYIPEINSTNFNVRAAAERAAINMPVQGTAADIIKIAMNRLQAEMDKRKLQSLMTLQVHDELIFECPSDELEEMRGLALDIMPKSMEMAVQLKIDTKAGKS
jgi:DNA polymerase-1